MTGGRSGIGVGVAVGIGVGVGVATGPTLTIIDFWAVPFALRALTHKYPMPELADGLKVAKFPLGTRVPIDIVVLKPHSYVTPLPIASPVVSYTNADR